LVVDAARQVAGAGAVAGAAGDEDVGQGGAFDRRVPDFEHAEYEGQDEGVDRGLLVGLAKSGSFALAEVDEGGLKEAVPEEAVVGALPEGEGKVGGGLALKAAGDVEVVGKVEGAGFDEVFEKSEVAVFFGVFEGDFAEREEFGGDDFIDSGAFDLADGVGLIDDDDVLVWQVLDGGVHC